MSGQPPPEGNTDFLPEFSPPSPPPPDTFVLPNNRIHDQDTVKGQTNKRIPIAGQEQGTPSIEAMTAGTFIGPYRLVEKIARGGMGHVYLAADDALRRDVALKLMEPDLLTDQDALKRFEREARACASIDHPNIAKIYMVGLSDEGQPFLAMEFVDGGSLYQVVRQRLRLPFSQALFYMEQVAEALWAARKQNIIHRDIKPANIMLTNNGEVRVVDFGLAKIFFEDSYRTQEGMVLGTPTYMAPEQGQGRNVDHRADIYSLGGTFYHVIAGRAPFTADTPVQIMMKHVTAPLIPMRSLNPEVPVELDEIIAKCMRKDVEDRYQDYESLISDIQRVRLMCVTHEKGSVIDSPNTQHSFSAQSTKLNQSQAVSSLPSPPTFPGGGNRSNSPSTTPASIRFDEVTEDHSGWTPVRIAIVASSALVVLCAVIFALLRPKQQDSVDENQSRKVPVFLVNRLKNVGDQGGEVSEAMRLYNTTESLSELRTAVNSYELTEKRYPKDLSQLVEEGRVFLNFSVDSQKNPLDDWGQILVFDNREKVLRSAGMDETYYTKDDLLFYLEGEDVIPSIYKQLIEGESQ